jgi:hypothetical protein
MGGGVPSHHASSRWPRDDNGAALLIRRRQARQMTIEVRFNLPFGFGEKSQAPSITGRARYCTDDECPSIECGV